MAIGAAMKRPAASQGISLSGEPPTLLKKWIPVTLRDCMSINKCMLGTAMSCGTRCTRVITGIPIGPPPIPARADKNAVPTCATPDRTIGIE